MEHMLKSAAIEVTLRARVRNSKELLEYLAMIDQQTRKAIGNLQTLRITTPKRSLFTGTQSLGGMIRIKGGCALLVKRIRRKREKYMRKLRTPHLTMSALAKEKAKARRGLATLAVSKDTLHGSVQLLKGKKRAIIVSRRNSGRSTTLASSRSSGTTGGQEIRKARAKAQTHLMEKEVCLHRTGRFVQIFHSCAA